MKAYTSRSRFDERRRFTAVREQMGRVRLDSDANEQATLVRTDARRRSGDLAEGSPDDGFRLADSHLIDPVGTLAGWAGQGLPADDQRVIPQELALVRRDPDTLPHVVRARGFTSLVRTLPRAIDLLHLPVPLHPDGATYGAAALRLPVRVARPPTDDEIVDIAVVLLDADGTQHRVLDVPALAEDWAELRIPLGALAALPRTALPGGQQALAVTGWGMTGLPPRAEVFFGGLLAEDAGLGDGDFVLRGGDGTLAGAGRIYLAGLRSFLEHDIRYSLQPDLPDPVALERPADPAALYHHVHLDVWERPIHRFQDTFLDEPALDGDDTTFRSRKVSQIRVRPLAAGGGSEALATPIGGGRLTTNVPAGTLPDRFPAEEPDPCRDRCLFSENVSTGEGYLGRDNIHVRVEILRTDGPRPVIAWSRNNAATVAPLVADGAETAASIAVDPADAARFAAGDVVVVEDEPSRLDPDREGHRPVIRRLRAVDTATGVLEFHDAGHTLTTDPDALTAGGPLGRAFRRTDSAAVRRWDGADWLLTGIRYNLFDGITFAFSGEDFRIQEFWTFTARVVSPDGAARGTVEQLTDAPVAGPWHERRALGRIRWTATGRTFEDLRTLFLPLHEVRNRLIELGRRRLAPGSHTVVVGDGVRTFGDIDQNLAEGVTGDEALQAAIDRIGLAGGTIYVRAGVYSLEHPVLVHGRSDLHILGDGDATRLEVTGAGGAFYLDRCGRQGAVTVEALDLVEIPGAITPIGIDALTRGLVAVIADEQADLDGLTAASPLTPADLAIPSAAIPDLLTAFIANIRDLQPGFGRAAASVVQTIARLRRLQRETPGQPLEDVAEEELNVLRRLPHGVVTIADSARVTLRRLTVTSREDGNPEGTIAAGVLITGSCAEIAVESCRIHAPSGIVGAAYGRYLTRNALILRPRSGLFLDGMTIDANHVEGAAQASVGIRLGDGLISGVVVADNRVDGFPVGIAMEDEAEAGLGAPVDRTVLRANRITGAAQTGIRITGDGVAVQDNEIRMPAGPATIRAGIQVAGMAHRIAGNWLTVTDRGSLSGLEIDAGILVGSGADTGTAVVRPVSDLDIADNRIEGTGIAGLATGILLGGAQPIVGVRIRGNTIRNFGDAGLRAWAHGGAIGGLCIEDNRIEGVARARTNWTPAVVAAIAALAPAAPLAGSANPRAALDTLLQQAGDVRTALDAVLRWLDIAALRGGIVLSLVDDSMVRGNRIAEIGSRALPQAFVDPGMAIRTAGIAAVGGRDLVIEDNRIARVYGVVELVQAPPQPPPGPVRPPIFDYLTRLSLQQKPGAGAPSDLHGAVVFLRRQIMAYTAGDRRVRQTLGGQIYAPMEAVVAALEDLGSPGQRLALELSSGLGEMLEAQGADDHTVAANLVRATLSDAAAFTAESETVASHWQAAAGFDHALLGEDEGILAAATELAETAGQLTAGLESVGLPLAERAKAVATNAGTAQQRLAARLQLAEALGTLAEARLRKVDAEANLAAAGVTAEQGRVLEGLVRLGDEVLGKDDPVVLNEAEIAQLETSVDALDANLAKANPDLAERLRQDFQAVKAAKGRPTTETAGRLRDTLTGIQTFARDPSTAASVAAADVEAQARRFEAELVLITAEQLDRRVGGLALDTDAGAMRNLRVLKEYAGQLVRITADTPELADKARAVSAAVSGAVDNPDNRREYEDAARRALGELKAGQETLAGVTLGQPVAVEAGRDPSDRLAGMGQLLLDLRGETDAGIRDTGYGLLEDNVRAAGEELGLRKGEREGLLRSVADARASLAKPADAGAAATALHVLAGVVETLSDKAATAATATAKAGATQVLTGAIARSLDPVGDDAGRIGALRRHVTANRGKIAAPSGEALLAAADPAAVLATVHATLGGLTKVRPPVLPPILPGPQQRAHPADGVFTAGVQARLSVTGNRVDQARIGATVADASGHATAPVADQPRPVVALDGNRIVGAPIGGLEVRPGANALVSVRANHILGCCGTAAADRSDHGQAAILVIGGGQLCIADNRLHDNGNTQRQALLHEILADWRGDATVQDNSVRHVGGGAGGAGLALLFATVDPALVARLCRSPALEVEPPPDRPGSKPSDPGTLPAVAIDDLFAAGLAGGGGPVAGAQAFKVGGFQIAAELEAATFAVLGAGPPVVAEPAGAMAAADAWIGRDVFEPFHALVDFLVRPPVIVLPPPLIRPRRAVHVTGNDIVANGPALLLLAQATALVSATVVGNELESTADTGAAYLRQVDTTVFSGNRCECLRAVTVAVIRSGRSLVTACGNAVAGTVPPPPAPPPIRPRTPDLTRPGTITLGVDLGSGSALSVALDNAAVLAEIEKRRDTAFKSAAEVAEASFNLAAAKAAITPDAAVASVLKSTIAADRFRLAREGDGLRLRPSASDLTAAADVDDGDAAAEPRLAAPPPAAAVSPEAVTLALDRSNTILANSDLSGSAKLFGIARLSGLSETQSRAIVQSQLVASGGDEQAALVRGIGALTGVAADQPTVVAQAGQVNVLEQIVATALAGSTTLVPEIVRPRPLPPPPPDPRDHSLVVIGGTKVGTAGNVTTAGVYVHPGPTIVGLDT
ncbi:MAG: hypothetical protein H6842_06840 [Rhodospirillaceae bacterium]|nr:hypothetical protein [Rhodospirillaceae bacterium]